MGVAFDTDVAAALQIIEGVVQSNARVLKDVTPVIGVASVTDSVIQISVGPWVSVEDYFAAHGRDHSRHARGVAGAADQSAAPATRSPTPEFTGVNAA